VVITRIAKKRNARNLYTVYVDDVPAFDVSDTVALNYGLKKEVQLDEQTIEAIKSTELEKQARMIALNYVSYRPRSSKEVLDQLIRKGFTKDLADSVVRHFESVSLINNLEFARMFVRDKLRKKPTGKALLQRQLAVKGIPTSMIEQVLREHVSEEDQRNAAAELASRRIRLTKRTLSRLDPVQQRRRLTGYLLRHGFSSEIVQRTVRALLHP
jgi:regulatory protein